VWGGAAGARLGTNLREQKGYSYGVFSFPHLYSKYALWVAGGGVQTNKTKESAIEFQKELRFIAGQKRVSEAELAGAKAYRVRSYAQHFESINRISQQLVELWALGSPMSDLQREPEEVGKTSLAAVNSTAERYASPGRATMLLVGDASKIEAPLREANLGELVLIDEEGNPATQNSTAAREPAGNRGPSH
jgi:zinc protease